MVFERERKYCKVDKSEQIFLKNGKGDWMCSNCMFVSCYLDNADAKKEQESLTHYADVVCEDCKCIGKWTSIEDGWLTCECGGIHDL